MSLFVCSAKGFGRCLSGSQRLAVRAGKGCFSESMRMIYGVPGKSEMGKSRDSSGFSPPIRGFSSSKPSNDDDSGTSGGIVRTVLSTIMAPQNQFYALVAGGTVGAYLISRILLGVTNFFTHLHPAVVAKYGFYTGFGTASFVGGLLVVTADNLAIRADPVFRYCSRWVINDSTVQQALGDGLKTGGLRSYRLDAGKFELEGTRPVWRPPRIQMIFDVTAQGPPYRTGLVTCEAIKQQGFPPRLETTLLMVDYETGNEGEGGSVEGDQTIFLKGSEEQVARVSSRSGLSLQMLARQVHINRAASQVKK